MMTGMRSASISGFLVPDGERVECFRSRRRGAEPVTSSEASVRAERQRRVADARDCVRGRPAVYTRRSRDSRPAASRRANRRTSAHTSSGVTGSTVWRCRAAPPPRCRRGRPRSPGPRADPQHADEKLDAAAGPHRRDQHAIDRASGFAAARRTIRSSRGSHGPAPCRFSSTPPISDLWAMSGEAILRAPPGPQRLRRPHRLQRSCAPASAAPPARRVTRDRPASHVRSPAARRRRRVAAGTPSPLLLPLRPVESTADGAEPVLHAAAE